MHIKQVNHNLLFSDLKQFDLAKTLDCGQFFRFHTTPSGSILFQTLDRRFCAKQEADTLTVFDAGEGDAAFLTYFLDLERDYDEVRRRFQNAGGVMRSACTESEGIRILRQDPYETLISFLLSSNNNIPRIQGIIERLCTAFGEKKVDAHGEYFTFPTPEKLTSLSVSGLEVIRSGYRAKYILSAAQDIASGRIKLSEIDRLSYTEAKKALTGILGVGSKVADCVLLFGFHKLEAFPIDVWIKRTIDTLYDGTFDTDALGEIAGIANQYLFYYVRKHKLV